MNAVARALMRLSYFAIVRQSIAMPDQAFPSTAARSIESALQAPYFYSLDGVPYVPSIQLSRAVHEWIFGMQANRLHSPRKTLSAPLPERELAWEVSLLAV